MGAARIRLHAPPCGVRIAAGDLDGVSRRCLDARIARERAEARKEGFDEGAAHMVETAAGALSRAAERLDAGREEAQAEINAFAVRLAVGIAGHVIRSEIDAGRYDIERMVRETLAFSEVGRASCTVHLNPEDLARLEGVPFRSGTELAEDPSMNRGDVHVTTPQGLLIRDLDAVLDSIAERLLEEHA